MKKLLITLAALACAQAQAECAVQLHVGAYHDTQSTQFNNATHGVGVLCDVGPQLMAGAGQYHNSLYRDSTYGMVVYQPLRVGMYSAGVFVGAVSGYTAEVIPFAGAAFTAQVTPKLAAHLIAIPAVSGVTPAVWEFSLSYRFK